MQCPYCGHTESRVTDSRDSDDGIRRRRECSLCGLRFSTSERVQAVSLMVVKRDSRREEFDRKKVQVGVLSACTKRPVTAEHIERLTDNLERELWSLGRNEIPSGLIGELVMEHLLQIDHVAYVRFASIYRNFQDVESFQKEIKEILDDGTSQKEVKTVDALERIQLTLPLSGDTSLLPKRTKRPK
jgi:transcriptional repressor NrdR